MTEGITTITITVHLAGQADPIEVASANPDLVRWDMTSAKHRWPDMEHAPMLWATFIAWAALKREGRYSDKWEQFWEHDCIAVEFPDTDAEDDDGHLAVVTPLDAGDEVGPTPPDREPGSV